MNHRSLAAAALVLVLASPLPGCVAEPGTGGRQLTVMTRNLYLGTGLTDVFSATSLPDLVATVSEDWAHVRATDFRARAGALADEIARARPDVIGLQEVTLWREQTPGDFPTHPGSNATRVVLDLLTTLQNALTARRMRYTAAALSTNADVEVPRRGPTGLVDLRVTDRDVLLVRADRAERFVDPRHGHYAAVLRLPVLDRTLANTRGWTTVDYRPDARTTVRILETHLEVGGREAGVVQARQGEEVLTQVAASPYPVIALGDFNSPADGSDTTTYARLSAVLHDAWSAAHPAARGPTCCQAELLDNRAGQERHRIDLVLTSKDWPVDRVARTGTRPFRLDPPPLWASDHVGLTARIRF